MPSKAVDVPARDQTENLAKETLLAFWVSFTQIHVLGF